MDNDVIIIRAEFEPKSIRQIFGLVGSNIPHLLAKTNQEMTIEQYEEGFLQIFKNMESFKRYSNQLHKEISSLMNNPKIIDEIPFMIGNVPFPLNFPPEGITIIFSPANQATNKLNLLEIFSETYRPFQQWFRVEPDPARNKVRLFFPTLKSLSIYMLLFNRRYFPPSNVPPPSPPPTQS